MNKRIGIIVITSVCLMAVTASLWWGGGEKGDPAIVRSEELRVPLSAIPKRSTQRGSALIRLDDPLSVGEIASPQIIAPISTTLSILEEPSIDTRISLWNLPEKPEYRPVVVPVAHRVFSGGASNLKGFD